MVRRRSDSVAGDRENGDEAPGLAVRFLLFCAGADRRYFGGLKIEEVRYVSVGAAVVVTSVFAGFSLIVALSLAFDTHPARYLPVGVAWSLAIFNLDRWLVSSVTYGSVSDPEGSGFGKKLGYKLALVPRLVLAIILGIAISEPLVLLLFRSEVDQELQEMHNEEIAEVEFEIQQAIDRRVAADASLVALAGSTPNVSARIDALERSRDDLKEREADLQEERDALQADAAQAFLSYEDELTEGQGGRGAGDGPIAARLRDAWQQLVARIQQKDSELADLAREVAATDQRLDELISAQAQANEQSDAALLSDQQRIEDEIRAEYQAEIDAIRMSDGLLAREEALARLVDDNPGLRLRRWIPALLILIVDSMPALLKFLSSESVHDRKARYEAGVQTLRARSEFELELERVRVDNIDQRAHLQTVGARHRQRRPEGSDGLGLGEYPQSRAEHDVIIDMRAAEPASVDPLAELEDLVGHSILIGVVGATIDQFLAAGGTSRLYLAQPLTPISPADDGKPIVVKFVPDARVSGAEAEIVSRLRHPNIAHLIGHSRIGDQQVLALAFEYHSRMSLDRYLYGTRIRPILDVSMLDQWVEELIDALQAVWSHGIVHADGKPQNILVGDGPSPRLLLTDFGESFELATADLALPGVTLAYAPPEVTEWWIQVAEGKQVPPAPHTFLSDVYSLLGGTLYYILSGGHPPTVHQPILSDLSTRPFDDQAMQTVPASMNALVGPRSIVDVVQTWLSVDPGDRAPGVAGTNASDLAGHLRRQWSRAVASVRGDEAIGPAEGWAGDPSARPQAPVEWDGGKTVMR